jgi:hypothetical protein
MGCGSAGARTSNCSVDRWRDFAESKGFRAPAAPELLSLCVAKEKVTKEKGHPAWRLPGIHARQVREAGPGFSNGHPARAKRSRPPVDSRYAACRPRLTAAQGPRVEQRAILARTRCATAARWRKRQTPEPVLRVFECPSSRILAREGLATRTAGEKSRTVEPGARPSKEPAAAVEIISRRAGKITRRAEYPNPAGREKSSAGRANSSAGREKCSAGRANNSARQVRVLGAPSKKPGSPSK